jgi:hypothetical protein
VIDNHALHRSVLALLPWLLPFALPIELNRRGRHTAASWWALLSIPGATCATFVAGLGSAPGTHIFLFVAAAIAPILLPVRRFASIVSFAMLNLILLVLMQTRGWPAHPALAEVPEWTMAALSGFLFFAALTSLFVVVYITEFWASTNETELGARADRLPHGLAQSFGVPRGASHRNGARRTESEVVGAGDG